MQPFLMSSDFDPMQVAIIVIALIAGFVKWLWETWQQSRSQARPAPPTPEEQRLREAAWRKQTGRPAGPPPIPPTAAPSAWDELRKAWHELQETAKQTQSPAQPPARTSRPPPVPQQARRQVRAEVPRPAAVPVPVVQVSVPETPSISSPPATVLSREKAVAPEGSILSLMHSLRRDPSLMRQAILMQEILGPPKALQNSGDLAI
ncbi:hypothetical protein [Prosthecobacter sp.]|uniref:hypothetical protein n=1 Tax=Prosthecobacter sp. TaxID=1965333 RepID=UPI001DE25961|nr:hypothetical protein [Prosthecobacter sp.]MCB1275800.1 hypothetical protein [Prosthecobacter sp.]